MEKNLKKTENHNRELTPLQIVVELQRRHISCHINIIPWESRLNSAFRSCYNNENDDAVLCIQSVRRLLCKWRILKRQTKMKRILQIPLQTKTEKHEK